MAPVDLLAALDLALPGAFVDAALPIAAVTDVLRGLVMTLFVISAILVLLVVLAQEGKGGGLSGAFGGAGAETFGVKAGTVNKFTSWVATSFLGLALIYAGMTSASGLSVEAAPTAPGFDAGPAEAGASDPSAPDSGASDSGASDSGASDSGASDSGASDSGASDSGASDSDASDPAAPGDDKPLPPADDN